MFVFLANMFRKVRGLGALARYVTILTLNGRSTQRLETWNPPFPSPAATPDPSPPTSPPSSCSELRPELYLVKRPSARSCTGGTNRGPNLKLTHELEASSRAPTSLPSVVHSILNLSSSTAETGLMERPVSNAWEWPRAHLRIAVRRHN